MTLLHLTTLHLTSAAQWAAGRIEPAPGEAFVHLSRPEQVHIPANLLYRGRRDLIALVLRDVDDRAMREEGGFPHLYRPIERDDVVDTVPFPCDDTGEFHLWFVPMDASESPAADLIEAMVVEMEELYGVRIDAAIVDGKAMPSATPADFAPPSGVYLVGYLDGVPVAGGGLKQLEPGVAEIKRMYVAPSVRGRGIARALLGALEDAAVRRGYSVARLDTGPKQPGARHLYVSTGYREIDNYNANPRATFFGEKRLT